MFNEYNYCDYSVKVTCNNLTFLIEYFDFDCLLEASENGLDSLLIHTYVYLCIML